MESGDLRSRRPYLFSLAAAKVLARRAASTGSLIVVDVSGLALGLYAALALRELYHGHTPIFWGLLWEAETTWLPFITLVTVLVFWRAGLYAVREERAGFGTVLSSLVIVAVLTVAFALGAGHDFGTYGLVPTAVVLTAACIGLFRGSYSTITGEILRRARVRRRALLVGDNAEVAHLRRALGSAPGGIAYDFAGVLTETQNGSALPRLGSIADLSRVLARTPVDEILVADAGMSEERLLEVVDRAHRRGVKVRVAPKTTDILARRARYVPGQGVPLFELRPPAFAGSDWVVKRGFDLVVSAVVVLVGLPLWIAIATAVKLSSPGPVFFRDRRVGLGEREFAMFKFRTMYADAAQRQREFEEANEADGALFKLKSDPRVTPVGSLLRRFSLDEIPQVLNVLRGEMSLVGPRPLPLRDYQRLEPWHRKRYLVMPGMTGLWQISGRSNLGFDDLVRLDFFYLENWSIWLDISVILKTIPAVLSRRGAY